MIYVSKPKQKKFVIDLNCDIGQSFGVYKNESELNITPYVSTLNVSCGMHAGDPLSIMDVLSQFDAKKYAICAHIGYPDLQGFGYREMNLSKEEMKALVLYQLGALEALAKVNHLEVEYVRAHGALYKQSAKDYSVLINILEAIKSYNPWLIYIGAHSEALAKASAETDIRVAHELMLDKVFTVDGEMDFDKEDVDNINYSSNQLELILNRSMVRNSEGGLTKIKCDTIHLGSKSKLSEEIAKKAHGMLENTVPVAVAKVASSGWL